MSAINKIIHNMLRAGIGLLLLVSQSAAAGDGYLHEKPFYVGIGINQSSNAVNDANVRSSFGLTASDSVSDDGFGWQLFAGLRFDELISMELGYVTLGQVQSRGASNSDLFDIESIYIDVVLNRQLNDKVSLFGKLGFASWVLYDNGADLVDGEDAHFGFGADINLYGGSERVMRIKWEHQEFDGLFLDDADTISVSMMFNF